MKVFVRIFLLSVLMIVVFSSCSILGMALRREDYKAAEKLLTRDIVIREKSPDYGDWVLYQSRAFVYLHLGETEKARNDFEKYFEIYKYGKEWDEYYLFHTYVPTAAFKLWHKATVDPTVNPLYHYRIGGEGDYVARIQYLDEAIDIAPDYACAYDSRANLYTFLRNYDQAAEDYKKAASLFADKGLSCPGVHRALIRMWLDTGDEDQAVEYYNKVAKTLPDERPSFSPFERVKKLAAARGTKSLADDVLAIVDDKADANYWTARAERGEARAQFQLGVHYANGSGGVRKDMARAVSWYARAAESGYDLAQYNLALCYLDGTGVARDQKKAFTWFLKAAEQGHAKAQYNAGVCYYFGEGTAEDINKAAYWFAKSAEQRNADAQFNLAMLYFNGEGVPEDVAKALFWFNQAVRNGHAKAREGRDTLIKAGYTLPQNSEQDMLDRGYTKAGEGVYRAILYKPFDDLKAGTIVADDNCVFISQVYVNSNFQADINTWFMVMDRQYTGNGAGVISSEPGKQKFFAVIFNDRTFIPKVGDTVYIGWRIDDTANVQINNDVEKTSLYTLSAGNGFSGILFESVPVAFAASYSESEVLEKLRTRARR